MIPVNDFVVLHLSKGDNRKRPTDQPSIFYSKSKAGKFRNSVLFNIFFIIIFVVSFFLCFLYF